MPRGSYEIKKYSIAAYRLYGNSSGRSGSGRFCHNFVRQPSGEVHFNLSCTFPDGEESEVAQYIIRGERSESYEEDGCKNFNARFFKISHNGEVTYRLKAGHSYTFQWMGTYWDLFED